MVEKQPRNPFTLFDLSDKIKAIIADIIDAEIAGDKDEVEALLDELDSFYDARASKREAYVYVIKNSLATSKACKAEAKAFDVRGNALMNLAKRLKERLLFDLQHDGEDVVNAGIFKIARQRNSQPSLIVDIEAVDLPADFQKLTVEVDTDALKAALNAGEKIKGARLELGEHIRIRVR